MDPSGKVAFVTGGARMGEAIARALAARGAALALVYRRSRDAAEAAAAAARAAGVRAEVVRADLTDEGQVEAALAQVERTFGRLDILVGMASTYGETPLDAVGASEWRAEIDANVTSAFLCARHAAARMRRAGGGRIVHVSDWLPASGRPRYRGYTPYYVAKGALNALTESLALELAPDILVNAVAPGPILPARGMSGADEARVIAATPLGRWGGAEEVAKAVLFLIESDFVTGEVIRVDGGRHLA